ncbi:MAG: Gfo/Idh/MocA family oxidoreductase, partial [Planctomycetes bacterium]|nr:Gfo/Idh/MocA family oxidoreductase [Planctomycetota bacterium]
MSKLRVLVVGCGNMGASHARAYHAMSEFDLVGLVSRGSESRERVAGELGGEVATFGDFDTAFAETRPDCVSINTYPDTHASLAERSMRGGAHVFLEKPLAVTVDDA